MSPLVDSAYGVSSSETTDTDKGVDKQAGPVTTGPSDATPAVPVSREQDADHMRQGPAAGADDDVSGQDGTGYSSESGDGDFSWSQAAGHDQAAGDEHYGGYPRQGPTNGAGDHGAGGGHDKGGADQPAGRGYVSGGGDAAVQAKGMTRYENADYMMQGPAAGEDEAGCAVAGDSSDWGGEPGASHPGSGGEASQFEGTKQAPTSLDTDAEPTEHPTPQPVTTDNGANSQNEPNAVAELSGDGGPPVESRMGQEATDNRDDGAVSTAGAQPDAAGIGLATPGPELAPQVQSSPGDNAEVHPGKSESAESSPGDADKPLPLEAERFKALEAELDKARQQISDLQAKNDEQADRFKEAETENAQTRQKIADLEADKVQQAARLDRIEQLLATTDGNPRDANTQAHGADAPGATPPQDASLDAREGSDHGTDAKQAEQAGHPRWRRVVSADNIGAAQTLIGAGDTVAQFVMHATPDGIVGLGTVTLGLTAFGLAKFEKHRKGRSDSPDKRQGGEGAA